MVVKPRLVTAANYTLNDTHCTVHLFFRVFVCDFVTATVHKGNFVSFYEIAAFGICKHRFVRPVVAVKSFRCAAKVCAIVTQHFVRTVAMHSVHLCGARVNLCGNALYAKSSARLVNNVGRRSRHNNVIVLAYISVQRY